MGGRAQWRKAPYVLVHHRSVLLAVALASLLAALAASSAPFVTTAAASEALKNKLADLSPYATGLEIQTITEVFGDYTTARLERDARARERAVARLRARVVHVRAPVYTTELSGHLAGPKGDSEVAVMSRTGALEHVKRLRHVSGAGVWISDITAADAGVKLGDVVRLDGLQSFDHPAPRVRIKGIYRALAHSPETPYWGNLYQEIYPQCLDCGVPPPHVFIDQASLFRLLGGRNATVQNKIELPVDPSTLTLDRARTLNREFVAVRNGLGKSELGRQLGCTQSVLITGPGAASLQACEAISSLSAAVTLADRNASAVTPAVTLLSDLGTGLALAIAAAAGVFLVRRRRAEAALLYARGESPGTFAARSALEAVVPTIVGGAAGLAIAWGLTDFFAPSGSISPGTLWAATAHAAVAVTIALALLVATAVAAFLRLYDTGSRRLPWLRWLPWELALIGAAIILLIRIRSGHAVSHSETGAHAPTLAVFVFPLLLVAGVAGVAARLGRLGLRKGTSRAGRIRSAPIYLAVRRLGAARGLVVVLAVVTAASLGAFFYVETLATSLHHTTIEKAYMATGSDAQIIVQESQQIPPAFPYPVTRVQFANQTASLTDGTPIDVMLVDPATLAKTLHWESDWGGNPSKLLDELGRAPSRPLPVIVTSDIANRHAIVVSGETVPLKTLGSVRAFPFMAQGYPLAITSYRAVHDLEQRTQLFDSLGVLGTYIWAKGPPAKAGRALGALGPTYPPQTINSFLHDPDVVLATRTFTFMRMIAIGAGVLALLGLLLYLQARQRSQVIASALARRMGLRRAAEMLSIILELVAILGFAVVLGGVIAVVAAEPVVRRIDPLPNDVPSPIYTVPVGELVIALFALLVLAVIAGALTSWFAEKADVGEALRAA